MCVICFDCNKQTLRLVMSHYGSSCHSTARHVTLRLVMSHYGLSCHTTARHVTLRLVMSCYSSSCHATVCHVTLRLVMSHYDLSCHATARHVTLRLCNSTNNIMHDRVQGELYMKRDCACEERQLVLLRPSVVDQVQHRCLFLMSGVSFNFLTT